VLKMSDSGGGLEGGSGRVFLQDQVLLAQLTGVKPGESIGELDDIQAQLSCITGSGVAIASHLAPQTSQNEHLTSEQSQNDLLSERSQNSVISHQSVVIDPSNQSVVINPSTQSVVIDHVVPQQLIVEDHSVIEEGVGAPSRTADEDLDHKHVLYQSSESDHRTKDLSDHRTIIETSNTTIESHTDTLDEILENESEDEIDTEPVRKEPVLLDREEVLNRLSEAEKFISSCYRDVVLLTMDDPTNRPFLNVFSKYPDKFLYDQSSLRMNVKMSDDMKLFCEVLTNNRELVREAAVENIEIDIKAIMDDLNEARYQTCVGLPSEGQDNILQKIRKSDIPNLLLEKYNGSLIYRARDCRFVVDCKIGETLHCMQCRLMGVELDEKYSKSRSLSDFVVPDDAVDEDLGGTLVSNSKKRRGRPKGSKNKLKSEIVDFKEEPEPDEDRTMFGDLIDLPDHDDTIEERSDIVQRDDIEDGMIHSDLIGHNVDDEAMVNPVVEVKEGSVMEYQIGHNVDNVVRMGSNSDSKRGKRKKLLSKRAGRAGRKSKIPLPVQCPEEGCNLSFDLIRQYKIHALEHTNTFPCSLDTCIKRFKSKNDLEAHERKHRGEKPYSCTECGKSYATKQDLRLHFRKHTGEKPFPCDVCGKCFSRTQQRKIHMVVHTGEKSFLCPECGNSFGSMSTLIDHRKRKHFEIREHKCDQCDRGFFTRQELEAHIRIHTGEKPFLCPCCNKAFARSHHLKRHMDTVHKDGKVRKQPPVKKPAIEDNFQYQILNISETIKKDDDDEAAMLQVTDEGLILESDNFEVENEECQDLTGRIVTVGEENQPTKTWDQNRSFKPHILSQSLPSTRSVIDPGCVETERGVTSRGGVANVVGGSSRVGVAGSLLQLAKGRDLKQGTAGGLMQIVNQNQGFTEEQVTEIVTQQDGTTSLRIVPSIKQETEQTQQYFTIIVNPDSS